MFPKARWALLGILVSLLLAAGCGDDDSDSGDSSSSGTNSGATDSGGSAGQQASQSNELAAKSPQEVLRESADALEKARSFHVEGNATVDGKRTAIEADYEQPSKLSMSLDQSGLKASIITTGNSVFIKANEAFWKQQNVGEAGKELAGRWFKAPSSGKEIRGLTEDFDPKTLSYCLTKDHGTLKHGGSAEVDGRAAVVLVDKGDRAGTAPGKLFVAATGEPFPLRMLLTGDERPGGKLDPRCEDEEDKGEDRAGDQLTFSRYNEKLGIAPPPKALDLSQQSGRTTES